MTNQEEQEINRKRKNSNQFPTIFPDEEENDFLALSLSNYRHSTIPSPPPLPPSPQPSMQAFLSQTPTHPLQLPPTHPLCLTSYGCQSPSSSTPTPPMNFYREETSGVGPSSSRPLRVRRRPTQAPREGKTDTVPAPFPWATTHRATVHSLNYLLSKQITTITGDVQCKRCERNYEMVLDLKEKFVQVGTFIAENKSSMHDRAPSVWMNPILPTCKYCEQENCVRPIISEKKKAINWLFLLLGQMLGCCTLDQLKYFCKHTKNHRTGAKDRVLYLTYLGLCKQLDPNGPFDR
ncbi:Hydroxyproline-rich glycoprotein family protein [Quillaja saponaria]|uniref:Hydroxyproline-rich glycoprotein family protein n=1 Tax=Quillaja saponaria TaxID=32244 RepID=A0AAD7PTI4_QUISA|nr:Hydroxyproline-rich glycoprotein family protein [Quillaja saponaria]